MASGLLFPANLAFDACGGLFPAHSSPDGVALKGNIAFVAENGSALVQNPTGGDIVRVDLRTGRENVFWRSPVKHDPLGVAPSSARRVY